MIYFTHCSCVSFVDFEWVSGERQGKKYIFLLLPRVKKHRGVSRIITKFKKELFVTLVQDCQQLANITKDFILDFAGVLGLLLR